jgi:hypothetical protein
MSEEWGPWIEHDGGKPKPFPKPATVQIERIGPGRVIPEVFNIPVWPGFYWRWKRVWNGFLSWEARRVCYDPDYAPVVRYRIRKPRSVSAERLAAIVVDPKTIIDAPEGPVRAPIHPKVDA